VKYRAKSTEKFVGICRQLLMVNGQGSKVKGHKFKLIDKFQISTVQMTFDP